MNNGYDNFNGPFQMQRLAPQTEPQPPTGKTYEIGAIVRSLAILWLLTFSIICYRSMSRTKWCWHRIIGIYAVGTMLFGIASILSNGITRLLWYGVLIHNIAEWYIIAAAFFGLQRFHSLHFLRWLFLYIFILSVVVVFVPLKEMFLIAEIQGATLDWLMPMMFALYPSRHHWKAFMAAMTHLVQIQTLFYGLNSGKVVYLAISSLLIFPYIGMWVMYARYETGQLVAMGPSGAGDSGIPDAGPMSGVPSLHSIHSVETADVPVVTRATAKSIYSKDFNGEASSGAANVEAECLIDVLKSGWHVVFLWAAAYACAFLNCWFVFWYIN